MSQSDKGGEFTNIKNVSVCLSEEVVYWICLVKGGRGGEGVVSFPELTTEIAKPEKSFRINCPVRSP